MIENISPETAKRFPPIKEAVCIQVDKVYDSCKDKDCVEDIRVFLTNSGQSLVDRAINVKCRKSEIIWTFIDVEPVGFDRGYFSVDIKFFFKITLDVFTGVAAPTKVEGLASFDKKVILFGSEGRSKIFQSEFINDAFDEQHSEKSNMPKAIVEVVDPICLSAKLIDITDKCFPTADIDLASVPKSVCACFDEELTCHVERKRVFVSLGLFSIIKIERNVQLLIPAFDFCVPEKECVSATEEHPCDLFDRIQFPTNEFFPLQHDQFFGSDIPSHHKPCK